MINDNFGFVNDERWKGGEKKTLLCFHHMKLNKLYINQITWKLITSLFISHHFCPSSSQVVHFHHLDFPKLIFGNSSTTQMCVCLKQLLFMLCGFNLKASSRGRSRSQLNNSIKLRINANCGKVSEYLLSLWLWWLKPENWCFAQPFE